MKRREGKPPPPSTTDLLVCFPSRTTRLTLMPKALCSPARPSEPNNRRHRAVKTSINGGVSPWSQTKSLTSADNDEPSSPKVTCAGQIKIRHEKPNSACKNWESVMEEIERLHDKKHNKRHTWVESLGFKKEIMQFFTCLRTISLDFRCFGSFTASNIAYNDEDEDEYDDFQGSRQLSRAASDESVSSRTAFSKWFMVLQENIPNENFMNSYKFSDESFSIDLNEEGVNDYDDYEPCAPPSNALMLMRSSSAPAKTWLEEMEEQDLDEEADAGEEDEDEEEEKKKDKEISESLVLMKYNSNEFDMLSSDIVKETWVVGGIKDALSRSRSWKR